MVSRFEKDMEKLGCLYETGYKEMKSRMPELKSYLEVEWRFSDPSE